jgi:hypothetical protein
VLVNGKKNERQTVEIRSNILIIQLNEFSSSDKRIVFAAIFEKSRRIAAIYGDISAIIALTFINNHVKIKTVLYLTS